MQRGIFMLGKENYEKIYGPEITGEIKKYVDIYAAQQTCDDIKANPDILKDADMIFTGWGAPVLDEEFLNAAPNLKIIFYGAGSIRRMVTDCLWERGITVTSAYAANAVPVAEYTLSQILFCLKRGWHYASYIKENGKYPQGKECPGAFGSTVGIISLGMIGRKVCELLRSFDVKIIAYDPYVTTEQANELNVEICNLEEVFRRTDVVSLHTPWLEETVGMIKGVHFAGMKQGASFINTSRGAVVNESEMIEVITKRPDLQLVLDVTWPEPPKPESLLYTLPNVVLTPHIAGSVGNECRRMGSYMLEELKRYLNGEPLKWAITREKAQIMA
jgi:phosphoglycerate dehydrogenase-like enzyme